MTARRPDAEDSGHDAARRATALLWGAEPSGRRGPKPAFSRETVVDAAIAEADERGLEALSMRAVAERLGVSTTGLYRYVPGRTELVALMADRIAERLPMDVLEGDWRERLTGFARHEWSIYHRHPWLLDAPVERIPPGPNTMARYDTGLAAALHTGLPAHEAVMIYQAVTSLVIGASRASTENAALTQQTGVSVADWWTQQGEAGLFDPVQDGRFPALAAVLEADGFSQPLDADDPTHGYTTAFEKALDLLLDGIAARLAASGAIAGSQSPLDDTDRR